MGVGTFDSRAVAIAYVRSDRFGERLAELSAQLERAKAAGDTELVERLEDRGPELQARVHRQGFGGAPIDDILALLEDDLTSIAEAAEVDLIVSKWRLAYLRPSAHPVDVTERLVACFEPDAATLAVIEDILGREPVPMETLGDHPH